MAKIKAGTKKIVKDGLAVEIIKHLITCGKCFNLIVGHIFIKRLERMKGILKNKK